MESRVDRLRARCARPDLGSIRNPSPESVSDETCADRLLSSSDARARTAAMMRAATPMERHLIELAFFEGYTHSEIAERLDLPLGTVKARIRSALHKMRRAADEQKHVAVGGVRDRELIAACA